MKRICYTNRMEYIVTEHKGAKYLVGESHKNRGELKELITQFNNGFTCHKGNTSFDKGHDIDELKASVKSSGASLACIYGNSKEDIINEYFKRVASTMWIWVEFNETTQLVTEYRMNKKEFAEFLNLFSILTKESGSDKQKVRFKATTKKMIEWLENF